MSSAVNHKGQVVAVKRSREKLSEKFKSRQNSNYFVKKELISDDLRLSLDFHLEASKEEYANNHVGKLFLYNLRLVEFMNLNNEQFTGSKKNILKSGLS